jgi:phosphatidylserine decarboxylase
MIKRRLRTKFEELRQASSIHGGMVNLCIAALGVRLSRVPIPSKRLRVLLYRKVYGGKYPSLEEAECEKPIWAYPSFNALFTRGILSEYRPIPDTSTQLLCPCDGRVQELGKLNHDRLITVKGIEYTIASLLPDIDTRRFHDGHFAIFFLSPGDCHRVFSPQDAEIEEVIHVPGSRLLVHPPYQTKAYPVFSLNERVILSLSTPLGACLLVLVAGWGVGNISLRFARHLKWRHRKRIDRLRMPSVVVRRGEWIGTFELGSTIILITEPTNRIATDLTRDARVKYGQTAFSFER